MREIKCDLLINNANIIDGSGKPAFAGSIAIQEDEIIAITSDVAGITAKKIVDAKGRYVTPGFIDIHTHVDLKTGQRSCSILEDCAAENLVRQGITSTIAGNCGFSANITEFLATIDTDKVGINVGLLAGHSIFRMALMGMENRLATSEEIEKMKGMVRLCMESGAFGLSSGLGYSPGNYANVEELAELCKVVKEYDGIYTSHIRNQAIDVRKSWEEIIETGRQSGVKIHISHCQAVGKACWGASSELIAMLERARNEGIIMTGDAEPDEQVDWFLVGVLIPDWVQADGAGGVMLENLPMKERLKNPELLPRIKEEIAVLIEQRGSAEGILFLTAPEMPEIVGKNLSEIAKMWNITSEEVVVKVAIGTTAVMCASYQCSYEDKRTFYSSPYCSLASDAMCTGVERELGTYVAPRTYGCFPKFIEYYIKEKGSFTLEEGIRKMTSLPAETMGIEKRGLLKEGMKADIVVFDYERIADNATYANPHQFPSGIDIVVVNGQIAVLEGQLQNVLAGVALRHGK